MSYAKDQLVVAIADPSDAEDLRQLAVDSGIDAWTTDDYRSEIANDNSVVLCVRTAGDLAGMLVARIVPGATENYDAELYNIAVQTDSRRCGVGSVLLSDLVDRLRDREVESLWLEVRESNRTAVDFYEKHGFKAEITRPNFYANPTENALIMRLIVKP